MLRLQVLAFLAFSMYSSLSLANQIIFCNSCSSVSDFKTYAEGAASSYGRRCS